jgi:hypothetical protein
MKSLVVVLVVAGCGLAEQTHRWGGHASKVFICPGDAESQGPVFSNSWGKAEWMVEGSVAIAAGGACPLELGPGGEVLPRVCEPGRVTGGLITVLIDGRLDVGIRTTVGNCIGLERGTFDPIR